MAAQRYRALRPSLSPSTGFHPDKTRLGFSAAPSNPQAALMQYADFYLSADRPNGVSAGINSPFTNPWVDLSAPRTIGVMWDKGSNPTLNKTYQGDFMQQFPFNAMTEVTDSYGNVFTRIPKFYSAKQDGNGNKGWFASPTPLKGGYLHEVFKNHATGKELAYVDIGKHVGSSSDDGLRLESKPNKYPLINKTLPQFRTLAQANGTDYQLEDVHSVDILQLLFYIAFGTINSQSIMQGYTTGQWSATHRSTIAALATNQFTCANATADQYRVGQSITCGASEGSTSIFYGRTITAINVVDGTTKAIVFDGAPVDIPLNSAIINSGYKTGWSSELKTGWAVANDGKSPMAFLGIESLWGDVWRFIDGLNINDGIPWVCKNSAQYMSNLFAAPYEQLSYSTSLTDGWAKTMGHDFDKPFASITSEVGGGASASAYYSDYYYRQPGQRVALLGGNWNNGSNAGLSYWNLNNSAANVNVNIGARLFISKIQNVILHPVFLGPCQK